MMLPFWACARLFERAHALGSMEPGHFLFPGFGRQGTKATHGTGYDPTWHQKAWRTAWRLLCKEAAWCSAKGIKGEIEGKKGHGAVHWLAVSRSAPLRDH